MEYLNLGPGEVELARFGVGGGATRVVTNQRIVWLDRDGGIAQAAIRDLTSVGPAPDSGLGLRIRTAYGQVEDTRFGTERERDEMASAIRAAMLGHTRWEPTPPPETRPGRSVAEAALYLCLLAILVVVVLVLVWRV